MPQHTDTPKKARIRGAFEFLKAKGLPYEKKELYKHFRVSERTRRRILSSVTVRLSAANCRYTH
ncbi:hypothetical protein LY78DRAFT_664717 [Colletotrichum sublineola]|nr:hypothetical protein LY78DRAFT_664717 [Colletotrichum sublineola]